jgi:hypothetical protein
LYCTWCRSRWTAIRTILLNLIIRITSYCTWRRSRWAASHYTHHTVLVLYCTWRRSRWTAYALYSTHYTHHLILLHCTIIITVPGAGAGGPPGAPKLLPENGFATGGAADGEGGGIAAYAACSTVWSMRTVSHMTVSSMSAVSSISTVSIRLYSVDDYIIL